LLRHTITAIFPILPWYDIEGVTQKSARIVCGSGSGANAQCLGRRIITKARREKKNNSNVNNVEECSFQSSGWVTIVEGRRGSP
jgi:hypothetical protein